MILVIIVVILFPANERETNENEKKKGIQP